jgi:catechol 2,3-dioxygenase-like lactoylglutathione lyase family enzyme
MTERLITHLRHIGLAVPDHGKQRDFFTGVWGLTAEHSDTGLTFLAAEGSPEQYVVRLRQADDKRVDLIAFGAASPADVDALAARLAVRPHRKIEPGESIPVRLSHVVVNSATPEATVAWYERHLGFRLSDTLMHPRIGEMMWFLRINPWHHSLAIARCPHASLHHASFELRGIDEYMRGTGRLLRAGVEKIWGPGRHLAGNNTFSYFIDPHGNTVEYTTELEQVDEDTWHPHRYDFTQPEVADQWGTANAINEFTAARSFNDPDRGLFTAPPV